MELGDSDYEKSWYYKRGVFILIKVKTFIEKCEKLFWQSLLNFSSILVIFSITDMTMMKSIRIIIYDFITINYMRN